MKGDTEMTYTKIYDSCYTIIGYTFDGGVIYRDAHTSWRGNDVLDGYEVQVNGKRVFYASTLKEAKAFVENKLTKKEEVVMRVKDLVKVVSSATMFQVYANKHSDEGGEYLTTFGWGEDFAKSYGNREVISIYPTSKDNLEVVIKFGA